MLAYLMLVGLWAADPQTTAPTPAETPPSPAPAYADIVAADHPVAFWRFLGTGDDRLQPAIGGPFQAKLAGAKLGEPARVPDKSALGVFGQGSIRIQDPGANSPLDFGLGDAITLEAWVNLYEVGEDQQVYVIGKGRTGNKGFSSDNQNYGLRLRGVSGTARISFLFRSVKAAEGGDQWHRWNADFGFVPGTGWHHIAVAYKFGDPASIRGYLNGMAVGGSWDYAGATKAAPVVDDDELWIGSAMGGSKGSTFHGLIDEVALYRSILPAERIAARVPPQPIQESKPLPIPAGRVLVEILEGIPDKWAFEFPVPPVTKESYDLPALAARVLPVRYLSAGLRVDRPNPFLLRMSAHVVLPEGELQLLARSRGVARIFVDGKPVLQVKPRSDRGDAHNNVRDVSSDLTPNIRYIYPGNQEALGTIVGDGKEHLVVFETIVGGKKKRQELGETALAIARAGQEFTVLAPLPEYQFELTDAGWEQFEAAHRQEMAALDVQRRRAQDSEADYWAKRHQIAREVVAQQPSPPIPNNPAGYSAHNEIDHFLNARLAEAKEAAGPLTADAAFVRRLYLDLVGRVPTLPELQRLGDGPIDRPKLVDLLLQNETGWADAWTPYWQDVLAENPGILKPTLNNTGPFRFWIHEALQDNKPMDRFATEVGLMQGSTHLGGPAGFAEATENDVPMAAKAHVMAQAFLGLEMKCARCHDAPLHSFNQKDLFNLAAMLGRSPLKVPPTSSVPVSPERLATMPITVSLKPGVTVAPDWPFADTTQDLPPGFVRQAGDSREQAIAIITHPGNTRFAEVMVNRVWARLLGRGLVDPVDDWELAGDPSHPELLTWLAQRFVQDGYALKALVRRIAISHAYQRVPDLRTNEQVGSDSYLFARPLRRRLSAEQIVDSLYALAGKAIPCEELNLDIDGQNPITVMNNLGVPTRAWEFTSLSNERDRPSLGLPKAQVVIDVLELFGWRASRPNPMTVRESASNVLQPAILANGIITRQVASLSDNSRFTALALADRPVEGFVDETVRAVLSRPPTEAEKALFVDLLVDGYSDRVDPNPPTRPTRLRRHAVSWSNHLSEEANRIIIEQEAAVRAGDPSTLRLRADWRERAEDMVWALVNTPEFVWMP